MERKKKLKRSKRARGSGTIKQRRLLNRCTPLPRRFLVGERCNASSWGGYERTSECYSAPLVTALTVRAAFLSFRGLQHASRIFGITLAPPPPCVSKKLSRKRADRSIFSPMKFWVSLSTRFHVITGNEEFTLIKRKELSWKVLS